MKKLKIFFIIFLCLLIILLIGGIFVVNNGLKVNNLSEETTINIDSDMAAKEVFDELEEVGAINNSNIAYYYSRLCK